MDEYKLLFHASWSDYEEDAWIIICEKDGKYFCQEGGHSVMDWSPSSKEWLPEPISESEALRTMLEWEEYEDTDARTIREIFETL